MIFQPAHQRLCYGWVGYSILAAVTELTDDIDELKALLISEGKASLKKTMN